MKKALNTLCIILGIWALCSSTTYGQEARFNKRRGAAVIQTEQDSVFSKPPTATMKFPRYNGGTAAMCKFICDTMLYPEKLKEKKISGTTAVIFMVHKDGSISDVEVAKTSKRKEFDEEAVRIVKSFPNWLPAEADGAPIDMKALLNIVFDPEKCECGKLIKKK